MKIIVLLVILASCAPKPYLCTGIYESKETTEEQCTSMALEGAIIDMAAFDGDGISGAIIGSTIQDCKMVTKMRRIKTGEKCVDNPEYKKYMKEKQAKKH